jgi:hypothetical protein
MVWYHLKYNLWWLLLLGAALLLVRAAAAYLQCLAACDLHVRQHRDRRTLREIWYGEYEL